MIRRPFDHSRYAFRALRVNKMRSALTMLGIIIGVGAVIAMLAVGTGRKREDRRADFEHGQQPPHHPPGQPAHRAACGWASGSPAHADPGRRRGHPRGMPGGLRMWPRSCTVRPRSFTATRTGPPVSPGRLRGCSIVRDWPLASGTAIHGCRTCEAPPRSAVLGQTIVDNLFGGIDPVGQIDPDQEGPLHGDRRPGTRRARSPAGRTRTIRFLSPSPRPRKSSSGPHFPGMVRVDHGEGEKRRAICEAAENRSTRSAPAEAPYRPEAGQ